MFAVGLGVDALHLLGHLRDFRACSPCDLGRGDGWVFWRLTLRHFFLLLVGQHHALWIEPHRLDDFGNHKLRVHAVSRVQRQTNQLHQLLFLCVTLNQGARSARVNGEVALAIVRTVQQQVLVVPANVWLRHPVIEVAGDPAKYGRSVVVQNLHSANCLWSLALLTLQQHGHAGNVFCLFQPELKNRHQLLLQRRYVDDGERLGYVCIAFTVNRPPDFARGNLPLAIGGPDLVAVHNHLWPSR